MYKEFTLSKDSWHAKLMKFMWKIDHTDFTHVCPYFWLSVLNVITVVCFWPLILIWLGISWLFNKLVDSDVLPSHSKTWDKLKAYAATLPGNPDEWPKVARMKQGKYDAIMWALFCENHTETHLAIEELRKQYQLEGLIKSNSNKRRINFFMKYIQPAVQGLLYLVVAGAIVVAVVGLWNAIRSLFLKGILGEFLLMLGLTVLGVAIVFGIIWFLVKITDRNFKGNAFTRTASKPFRWIWRGLSLIGEVIASIYRDNCPPINWK